jgi:hypothetical protein
VGQAEACQELLRSHLAAEYGLNSFSSITADGVIWETGADEAGTKDSQ